ncbi:MAG: HD domain-containing protein [Thermodesulfobacteriota bacterium]|nr:HD domain-containing protein [Thermodesulfobacteriota bacterium]
MAHFLIPHHYLIIHGFLRRIYYIPIILTGLFYGFRKASYLTGFIVAIYLPFVFLHWKNQLLSANLEEIYEMLIFAFVGGITGYLSDKERQRRMEVQEAYHDTVIRLATATEYRDENTGAHLHRMSRFAEVIAKNLGLPPEQIELIKLASPMHDIGKIGVHDDILLNKGGLRDYEFEVMKTHTEIGHQILKDSNSPLLKTAETIAWTHHERYDGSGYPRGLHGEDIPLEGRIAAVADVFDALTTFRPYKPEYKITESIKIMEKEIGSHFDPRVFEAFLKGMDEIERIKEKFSHEQKIQPV